jgi:hypothetical protein
MSKHNQRIEQYIREGRTVSGANGNPPDKPGFVAISFFELEANPLLATMIDAAEQAGYKVVEQSMNSALLSRGYVNLSKQQ